MHLAKVKVPTSESLKLMLCFTDYLPSKGDPAGWEKIKINLS